jgi:hypothetical protein
VADDLAHILDEAEGRSLVPAGEPRGDLRASPGDRNVDAALRGGATDEPPGSGDALAQDPAHLVAGPGVDVAAQGVPASALVDAEVLDRYPAMARPWSRPVNAIEHACVLPRLSLSGVVSAAMSRSLSGLRGRGADGDPVRRDANA